MGWGGLLESEEERAGPDDEEHGQVEDSFLPGHHHSSVAAERVFSRQLLPFSHLSRYHHRRHVVPCSASLEIYLLFFRAVKHTLVYPDRGAGAI